MNKRNGTISLLKFICALIIMVYHFICTFHSSTKLLLPVKVGYLAVDFFFIVSGFYFGLSVMKDWNKRSNIYLDNLKMIWKKIKKLLPYSIVSFTLICIFAFLVGHVSISKVVLNFFSIFFLSSFGLFENLNGVTWFVSSMFIVMAIIYPLMRKVKVNYIYYWGPFITLILFGILYRNYNNLDIYDMPFNNYLSGGIIRAFVDINIGIILGYIIKEVNLTVKPVKLYICIISFIEIILYLFIIAFMLFYPKKSHLDFLVIPLLIMALSITFSENSYAYKLLSNKVSFYLEKISIPIMFNHFVFIQIANYFNLIQNVSYNLLLIIICFITIVFSILEYHLFEWLLPKINIKKYFMINNKA